MNGRTPVFFYGTLRDPELLGIVAGRALESRPARLAGHAVRLIEGGTSPAVIAAEGRCVEGCLVAADAGVMARLAFFETGYRPRTLNVETGTGTEPALVYLPHPDWRLGRDWSYDEWLATRAPQARAAATEFMRLVATHAPDEAGRCYPQIEMRADSRIRAARQPSPPLAPAMDAGRVAAAETRQPYARYFAVREDVLRYPLFGGGQSPAVERASFLGGDAVTVLPYDPSADRVLMVRQFRHGAFARGDANPWTLEPPAGRIDAGETPEEAARRELREETGIDGGGLIPVARYYPSPGAYSEYLYSYVALVDLAGRDGTVAGLAAEAEDIMAHVMALDAALALVPDGTVNTAPLILSLMWLAANRGRLGA